MKGQHKVGIVGHGILGLAIETGLQRVAEIRVYDKYKDTENLSSVVENSEVLIICVPTPMDAETGYCDTSIVEEVCVDIDKLAEERKSIVIKSTVPPGTTQMVFDLLKGRHDVVFCPEFLTQANFIEDFLRQDRILIGPAKGCKNEGVVKILNLFEDFAKTQEKPAFIGELSCAEVTELVKYTANSFLATKVSFFNEIYDIVQSLDLDYEELETFVLMDKRIGKSHTKVPGPDGYRGYGGLCLVKDLNALIALADSLGVTPMLLESVNAKNLLVREVHDWEKIKGATTNCSYDDE